jgi:hypothetical protein
MADAPQPSIDTRETDKKMRERVDKLIGQATSESSGSITLSGRSLERRRQWMCFQWISDRSSNPERRIDGGGVRAHSARR